MICSKLYRPDLDALRAVAVLAVIAFHFDGNLLKGGFLGVDVFFVLSGYLITLLIFKQIQNGNFSLLEFWKRRISTRGSSIAGNCRSALISEFSVVENDWRLLELRVGSHPPFTYMVAIY
jgi:hypothetical protein